MRRQRPENEVGARRVDALLGRLARSLPVSGEHDLRALAQAAVSAPRRIGGHVRPWRPLRLRLALAAALTLLVGSGLGFGVGTWMTPSGSAKAPFHGLGFLPASGWTVVQSGRASATDAAAAVAANVPVHSGDVPGELPLATLASLRRDGIVLYTRLTTRGDVVADTRFPVRPLPLSLADATPERPEGRAVEYRLRAAVGGYNVDARVFFGATPSPRLLAEAERQLQRLVVAPDRVTLAARPQIARWGQSFTLFGSVATAAAGQEVTVQFKACGLYPVRFRDIAETTTREGGGWSVEASDGVGGSFRAVAGGETSAEVAVKQRPYVALKQNTDGTWDVSAVGKVGFWHRRALVQRFDRRLGTWKTIRRLLLTDQKGAGSAVWTLSDRFRMKVEKGTALRAVLPLEEARPCYLAGYSPVWTT